MNLRRLLTLGALALLAGCATADRVKALEEKVASLEEKVEEVAKSGGNYIFSAQAWQDHGPQEDDSMMISTAFRQNLRKVGLPPLEIEIDCRARQGGRSKVLNPRTLFRTARQVFKMDR